MPNGDEGGADQHAVGTGDASFPWGRVVVFSAWIGGLYAGLLGVVSTVGNAILLSSATFTDPEDQHVFHFGLPRDIRWFFIGVGIGSAVAAVVCAFVARRIWRRDNRRLGWGFLIGVPFMAVVSLPVGLLGLGLGAATSKVADLTLPSQNYVNLHNDTSATVEVRYCVKQECAGASSVTLPPGHSHRYAAPKDDPTPDEFVITTGGSDRTCDLVPTLGADESGPVDVEVSEADAETC